MYLKHLNHISFVFLFCDKIYDVWRLYENNSINKCGIKIYLSIFDMTIDLLSNIMFYIKKILPLYRYIYIQSKIIISTYRNDECKINIIFADYHKTY